MMLWVFLGNRPVTRSRGIYPGTQGRGTARAQRRRLWAATCATAISSTRHFVERPDLSVVVRMANAAHKEVTRPIDYYHMPVPRNRDDEAYFRPAEGSRQWRSKTLPRSDSPHGRHSRVPETCGYRLRKYVAQAFGVATECGLSRRPKETIPELLRVHREVAAAL